MDIYLHGALTSRPRPLGFESKKLNYPLKPAHNPLQLLLTFTAKEKLLTFHVLCYPLEKNTLMSKSSK